MPCIDIVTKGATITGCERASSGCAYHAQSAAHAWLSWITLACVLIGTAIVWRRIARKALRGSYAKR